MAEGTGLVLAAGRGRRFGADKRQAPLDEAHTLLSATLARWTAALGTVRVVLRDSDSQLAATLHAQSPGLLITLAAEWRQGMGASLAAGARDCGNTRWLLVGLGDMPWVETGTLKTLAGQLDDSIVQGRLNTVVRPRHQGQWGQPVGFGCGHLPALRRLDGDRGARHLIRHADPFVPCEIQDAGVLLDVDTPADLSATGR